MTVYSIPGYGDRYFVTSQGEIFRKYKTVDKQIKGYKKRNIHVVKLFDDAGNMREVTSARVVWESIRGSVPKGCVVSRKTKVLGMNHINNLRLVTLEESGKVTGGKSKSKAVVLYENGKVINSWESGRTAASELFISRQTVSDICNRRVKKRLYDLRWERN